MAQAPGGTTRLKYAWTLGSFDRDSERSPTHQPTNPPTHQPTNPPTHQPTHPPTHQPTNPSTHQPQNHTPTILHHARSSRPERRARRDHPRLVVRSSRSVGGNRGPRHPR